MALCSSRFRTIQHPFVFLRAPSSAAIDLRSRPCVHATRLSLFMARTLTSVKKKPGSYAEIQGEDRFDQTGFRDPHRRSCQRCSSRRRKKKQPVYYNLLTGELIKINCPVWPVPGNHENFGIERHLSLVSKDHPLYGRKMYHSYLGPDYYSFNHGGVHFIGLNSLDFEDLFYFGSIDSVQEAWLKKDLAVLPPSTPVVTFQHVPFFYRRTEPGSIRRGRIVGVRWSVKRRKIAIPSRRVECARDRGPSPSASPTRLRSRGTIIRGSVSILRRQASKRALSKTAAIVCARGRRCVQDAFRNHRLSCEKRNDQCRRVCKILIRRRGNRGF